MDEELLKDKVILVVDDETDLRDIVASELEFMGAKVFQAENISTAQKIINQEKIELIVSDIRMPGGTGIDLLDSLKSKDVSNPPVILITGFADITVEDAYNKGAEALVNKPFKLDDLIKQVIRYASPFEERFKEEVVVQKSISFASEVPKVKFGRGGFSIEISIEGRRFDVGEAVDFNFKYENKTFQGTGVCRWLKVLDHQTHRALLGLEFMNLSGSTLQQFKQIYDSNKFVPYIPTSG
jgi:CheY-like chemotaxis protein